MAKTLVIAEKPSVGRDLARVLPGPFKKEDGWLESEEWIVAWAVGHLVQLAEPESYDAKYKRWRMADLPIVPDKFKLEVRDERSQKQMNVLKRLLKREDVDLVINACDAGREGELIFAYIFQVAGGKKPVKRLWLNSMTTAAMKEAFAGLRAPEDVELLEEAARSRSEADWIVGMNATRAATIRLKSSFDGAVSLGRVQTPTLAIVARREEEIRAFKPEPYWLVDATFAAPPTPDGGPTGDSAAGGNGDGGASAERIYSGRYHAGSKPRIADEQSAAAIVAACERQTGVITKLERKEQRERVPLLYDLTSLQRDGNTRFGFSARRTLAAAQRLYEEHKALTYPRTNSRWLTKDMIPELKPIADLLGGNREYAAASAFVTALDLLPLARVVNDSKVTDHHAIIPTRAQHDVQKMNEDDRRIYDLVVRRFLAVFHPEAVFQNTRVETTVSADGRDHVFRTRGKLLLEPGWRGVYGESAADVSSGSQRKGDSEKDDDDGVEEQLPKLQQDERVDVRQIDSARKETKPPRRYSDASLLGAMETAGKLVDDEELREAMKDSGIGTPATRAAIIERLIQVGYLERDGRALVATEKGCSVIRLLDAHPITSPELTGSWEHRLAQIESGADSRKRFMSDIASFAQETVTDLDGKLKDVRIPRATLGPCPVCGNEIVENRKGFSCWSREDPGCGFVIWKDKAGKRLPAAVARELIKTGYTAQAVGGFRGRSGRGFRAHLALQQSDEGRWRLEFNEQWAREGVKPPDAEAAAAAAAADGSAANGTSPERPARRASRRAA